MEGVPEWANLKVFDILKDDIGIQDWKLFGDSFNGNFGLTPGSVSWPVLEGYMSRKNVKFSSSGLTDVGRALQEVDPDQIRIGDEAMARHFQRQREEAKRLGMTLKAYRKKLAAEAEARANR